MHLPRGELFRKRFTYAFTTNSIRFTEHPEYLFTNAK
jgi:hypothetical protein